MAAAQDYPTRAVRVVSPFAAGGPNDIVARLVAQKLSEGLGQQFVVDNRAGAGGNLGTDVVAKAPADGYTLLCAGPGSLVLNPLLYKVPYDTARDFAPISVVATAPNVLVVHPAVAAKTLNELLALARAQPGRLNYASAGTGSAAHFSVVLLSAMAGVELTHVPYKGTGPGMNDLIGGQVQLAIYSIPPVLTHIRNGKLRALAVTGKTRSSELPEVPTVDEAGVPGYEMNPWYGLLAPAGTPRAVIARLNSEVSRIVRSADMREKLAAQGAEPGGGTPEDYAALIRADIALYARVIKEAGIKPE